jgi:glycosyltransferase involved in cell wall biosynthesis
MVVPSRHDEPASNVIIEAMASGVPVIATRAGGNPELVTDGETGFLVQKRSSTEIAAKILQLAADEELRARLHRVARETACQRFDASKNALAVQELMLSTLG